MQLVTIFKSFNLVDADLVNSRLAAADFHPTLTNDLAAMTNIGGVQSGGGILVQVPEDEVESAREFLGANDENPPA